MGQEIYEFVEKLNMDFSASNLEKLLYFIGAIEGGIKAEQISFNQFIFLRSSTDEVYGTQERRMIGDVDSIFIFPETKKTVSKGMVSSRIVAADLSELGEDIHSAVLFMKIIIKAYDGWPIFILRLSDGIHIGMRVYERDHKKNCTLSEASQVEEILGNYMWSAGTKDFLMAYSIMYETVSPVDESAHNFDEMAMMRRGVHYGYIESLETIEHYMHLDMSYAIRCYKEWFEKENEYPFCTELQDVLEDLQYVKSSKVNTLEMLFEAEELERITSDNEQKYMQTLSVLSYDEDKTDEAMQMSGKDPEEMIKLLKERRGII